VFGLARTGSSYNNGSGDYAIAFSTAESMRIQYGGTSGGAGPPLSTDQTSSGFEMALEAVEEAAYNSLLQATTVESKLGKAEAIPFEAVRNVLAAFQ
jgi:D-aminopeptidase